MIITLKIDNNVKKSGLCSVYFNVSHGKSGEAGQVRKRVYKSLEVNPKQFDKKNFRAKPKHDNQATINEALKKYKEIKLTCETKFDAGQYTIEQVIRHLKGKSNIDSVDDYIEEYLNGSVSYATYQDYKNTLNAFKKHLGFDRSRPVTFNEFSNNTLLGKFKQSMVKNSLSNNTINSYFTKVRAIMNWAEFHKIVFERFKINKRFIVSKPPVKPQTCTVEEFVNGIDKCKTIYHVQALGFWLLMFGTRGTYPADIVQFEKLKLSETLSTDYGDEVINDGINKLVEIGENILVHRRHKTRKKSNEDMKIKIDLITLKLFTYLKLSVILTHFNRPNILGAFDDNLSIFDYDVEDKDHANIWSSWGKHCRKLIGYNFKQARKTFNTFALKLKVTSDVRQVLLGQKNMTMLQYYDDLSVIEDEVNEAHKSVLKAFEFEALVNLVVSKLEEVDSRISTMIPPYDDYIIKLKNKE